MVVRNGGVVQKDGGSTSGAKGGDGEPHLKKRLWTATEDALLVEYVRKNGERNWDTVRQKTGLARCGKSCRERWVNHLQPDLKKGPLSPEEERIIVEMHSRVGNKWAHIAARLPGRTDTEIKNYWNVRVKSRQRQGLPVYPPQIQSLQQNHTRYQRLMHFKRTTPIPSTPITPNSSSFQTPQLPLHSATPNSTPPPLHEPSHGTPVLLPLFDKNEDNFSSSVSKPKEVTTEQNRIVHKKQAKLLNLFPTSSMQVPDQWYSESGEASNRQFSVETDDNIRVGDASYNFFISSGHRK